MTDREAIYELAVIVAELARSCPRIAREAAGRADRIARATRPSSVCPACGGCGRAVEATFCGGQCAMTRVCPRCLGTGRIQGR